MNDTQKRSTLAHLRGLERDLTAALTRTRATIEALDTADTTSEARNITGPTEAEVDAALSIFTGRRAQS